MNGFESGLESLGHRYLLLSFQGMFQYIIINFLMKIINNFFSTFFLYIQIRQIIACPQNCSSCQPNRPTVCVACSQDYELNVFGECQDKLIDNCIIYGPNVQCYGCQPTYRLELNKCIKDYSGCMALTRTGCIKCSFGLNSVNKQCIGVINCKEYIEDSLNQCRKCNQGYTLHQGKCVDTGDGCAVVRKQDGICSRCKLGYRSNGYQCVDKNIQIPNCYIYGLGQTCQYCKSGYKKINGNCIIEEMIKHPKIQIKNCQNIDQTLGECVKCSDRYYLSKDKSLCEQVAKICEQYSMNNGSCLSCKNGAVFYGGSCFIASCEAYNPDGLCKKCFTGYKVIDNGTKCRVSYQDQNCVQKTDALCIECKPQFYYSPYQKKCTLYPSNCQKVNPQSGICLNCSSGYSLNQQLECQTIPKIEHCIQIDPTDYSRCILCKNGYYFTETSCQRIPYLCSQFSQSQQICRTCKINGFNVSILTGQCVDSNCIQPLPITVNTIPYLQSLPLCYKCKPKYQYSPQKKLCIYNDSNCLISNAQGCLRCKQSYYLTVGKTCNKLVQNCLQAYPNGQCFFCVSGYELKNKQCIKKVPLVENCEVPDQQTQKCKKCKAQHYLRGEKCQPVPKSCESYNYVYNLCVKCKSGYQMKLGDCIESVRHVIDDPNCLKYDSSSCIQCSNRYYLDRSSNPSCKPVNILCKQHNNQGHCTQCYQGYNLYGIQCVIQGTIVKQIKNCKQKNPKYQNQCLQCFNGFYFSAMSNKCERVNQLCETYDRNNGKCLTCFKGYKLSESGSCSPFQQDPYCNQYVQGNCVKCANRYYYNKDKGECTLVNLLCQTYDSVSGICTSCYPGYTLTEFGQQISCTIGGKDPNCKYGNGKVCNQCYQGYFLINNQCERVNELCKDHNPSTGNCETCYQGYTLKNGQCVISKEQTVKNRDNYCKILSLNSNFCQQCYPGYFPYNGSCKIQNTLCKTIDRNTGSCIDCWPGYTLLNGNCSLAEVYSNNQQTDVYCLRRDRNNDCVECSKGYYFNNTLRKCEVNNPLCNGSDQAGGCLDCYKGYSLINRACILENKKMDQYCQFYREDRCKLCRSGYSLRDQKCDKIPTNFCIEYDFLKKRCEKCQATYILQKNQCIFPAIRDQNCIYYENSYCKTCKQNFYLRNYRCLPVDPDCFYFDRTQKICYTCLKGKRPQGASCI